MDELLMDGWMDGWMNHSFDCSFVKLSDKQINHIVSVHQHAPECKRLTAVVVGSDKNSPMMVYRQ